MIFKITHPLFISGVLATVFVCFTACNREQKANRLHGAAAGVEARVETVVAPTAQSAPPAPKATATEQPAPDTATPTASIFPIGRQCTKGFPDAGVFSTQNEGIVSARSRRWLDRQAGMQTPLPDFLSRQQILAWTEQPDTKTVNVSAKRWLSEGTTEQWVVVAADQAAHVALIEVNVPPSAAPIQRIAKSAAGITTAPQWGLVRLDYIWSTDWSPQRKQQLSEYTRLLAIDTADFRFNTQERLFGLLFATNFPNGYGRIAGLESLTLIRRQADTLVPVWDGPIKAGLWGTTRGEPGEYFDDWAETSFTVHTAKETTQGAFDLLLRNTRLKEAMRWKWNATRGVYDCAD